MFYRFTIGMYLSFKHEWKVIVEFLVSDMQCDYLWDKFLVAQVLNDRGIPEQCIYTFLAFTEAQKSLSQGVFLRF